MSEAFRRYQRLPGMVLGFHGCDRDVGEELLRGETPHLKPSNNLYDWLGGGVYFWENDPQRAHEFAVEAMTQRNLTKGLIKEPFVVGAVIELGLCLNLLDRRSLADLEVAYTFLTATRKSVNEAMPENKGPDRKARFLDRAVIETLHASRDLMRQAPLRHGARRILGGRRALSGCLLRKEESHPSRRTRLGCDQGVFQAVHWLTAL